MLSVIHVKKKTPSWCAVQFTGENAEEIMQWAKCANMQKNSKNNLEIFTSDVTLHPKKGDFIVVRDGRAVMCEKSLFDEIYETLNG